MAASLFEKLSEIFISTVKAEEEEEEEEEEVNKTIVLFSRPIGFARGSSINTVVINSLIYLFLYAVALTKPWELA